MDDSTYFAKFNRIGVMNEKRRKIKLPQITLKFSLRMSRMMSSFIVLRVRKGKSLIEIGKTESILNSSSADFGTLMNFYYNAENDEGKKIVIEVWDGDKLGIKEGYIFTTIEIYIQHIFLNPIIMIFDKHDSRNPQGHLIVDATVNLKSCVEDVSNLMNKLFCGF